MFFRNPESMYEFYSPNFRFHFLEGCKVSLSVMIRVHSTTTGDQIDLSTRSYIDIYRKLLTWGAYINDVRF